MHCIRPSALVLAMLLTTLGVGSIASASPAAVDVEINVGVRETLSSRPLTPANGSVAVSRTAFILDIGVDLITAAPGGRPKVHVELGGGLRFGADNPDPTEGCTSTATTGDCQLPGDLQPVTGQTGFGWFWDVVAPGNGTYSAEARIVETADVDPDTSNNVSRLTIVVSQSGGAGGSGSGGGGTAAATASAVKLSPARPKAGSTVVASVRVTRGGSPVRPTGVTCAATLGKVKVRGGGRASSGVASCLFKTPKNGKGKSLVGSVSFRAGGTSFTKRFATKLR